jgi:hypothetical protein
MMPTRGLKNAIALAWSTLLWERQAKLGTSLSSVFFRQPLVLTFFPRLCTLRIVLCVCSSGGFYLPTNYGFWISSDCGVVGLQLLLVSCFSSSFQQLHGSQRHHYPEILQCLLLTGFSFLVLCFSFSCHLVAGLCEVQILSMLTETACQCLSYQFYSDWLKS